MPRTPFIAGVQQGVRRLLRGARAFLTSYEALAALICSVGVLALLTVPEVPRRLAPVGLMPGLVYYVLASYRDRRRQRVALQPFPESWRDVLLRRVPLYRQLDPIETRRFEREIQIFLSEQRIYTLPGSDYFQRVRLTDEHRVLIAASAATLLLGRPEWRLPTVRDIVVYPGAFTEESYDLEGGGRTIGMVHAQGPILLSLPALLRAYPEPGPLAADPQASDHGHVGLHEFAHVLDFIGSSGQVHGVPMVLAGPAQARWHQQMQVERARLEAGVSVLNPYGLKNDAELFAVAVESFFLEPIILRAQHPELYVLLAELFNQDPATRVLTHMGYLPPWFSAGRQSSLPLA